MTSMTNPDQTDGFRSTVPMLSAIGLTAVAFAGLIVWQVSGVPIVAILLVPWLGLMVGLVIVTAAPTGAVTVRGPMVRDASRRQAVAVAGLAAGAILAAVTVSSGWAAISPDTTSGQNAGDTSAARSAVNGDDATGAESDASGRDC